jgi:hypothetical protein
VIRRAGSLRTQPFLLLYSPEYVESHRGVGFGADGVYSPPTAMMLAIVARMEDSMSPAKKPRRPWWSFWIRRGA